MLGCLCICEWNQYWDTQMVKISGYSWILVPNGQGGRHGGTMVRNRTCTQVQLLVRAGQYRADQSFVPLVPTSITWHWRIPGKWQWCNCCDTVLLGIRALPIQDLKIAWDVTVCTNVADWYSQIRHWTSCRQRCLKYANLIAPYKFQPVAVCGSLGPMYAVTHCFLSDFGLKISERSGNPFDVQFLFQQISMLIHHFYSVLFHEIDK